MKDAINEMTKSEKEKESIIGGGDNKTAAGVIVSAVESKRNRARIDRILGKEVFDDGDQRKDFEENEINEEPTRDISTIQRLRAKDGSKRKSFAHIISGNPETCSEA